MNSEPSSLRYRSISPSAVAVRLFVVLCGLTWIGMPMIAAEKSDQYEIMVHAGQIEETIEFFKSRDFWGESTHGEDLDVPRIILAVASKGWTQESSRATVQVKKEIFYRALVPLILLSNELILEDRHELEGIHEILRSGQAFSEEQQDSLRSIAEKYGLQEIGDPLEQAAQLLERVDAVPASLALGQTAYESGYGTSRFATEGNALFGQWTYSGDGMKPKEHRASKGNYGVAAYEWPFDSVRSYMQNLNTHSAYQALRDRRAELRKQGKEVTGLGLAGELGSYSEKGMEYVETLKSIIRVNRLGVADKAYLRDEPVTLSVGVAGQGKVEEAEAEIERLRASGELDRIIAEMRLD